MMNTNTIKSHCYNWYAGVNIVCSENLEYTDSYAKLRKQQCWDYKDKNVSTSLKNRKLHGSQEMHKKMKDEKAIIAVYIFIMAILPLLLNIWEIFIDTQFYWKLKIGSKVK